MTMVVDPDGDAVRVSRSDLGLYVEVEEHVDHEPVRTVAAGPLGPKEVDELRGALGHASWRLTASRAAIWTTASFLPAALLCGATLDEAIRPWGGVMLVALVVAFTLLHADD